jgi:hypothetical protein
MTVRMCATATLTIVTLDCIHAAFLMSFLCTKSAGPGGARVEMRDAAAFRAHAFAFA